MDGPNNHLLKLIGTRSLAAPMQLELFSVYSGKDKKQRSQAKQ